MKLFPAKILTYFGYAMIIKIFASVYYMIETRNFGTPFKNSLDNDQLALKERESKRRGEVYLKGLLVGSILMWVLA